VEQDIRELVGGTCLLSFNNDWISCLYFCCSEASIISIPLKQLSYYVHVL
jgi:hypothetical protein